MGPQCPQCHRRQQTGLRKAHQIISTPKPAALTSCFSHCLPDETALPAPVLGKGEIWVLVRPGTSGEAQNMVKIGCDPSMHTTIWTKSLFSIAPGLSGETYKLYPCSYSEISYCMSIM